jgi:hypothetical protein
VHWVADSNRGMGTLAGRIGSGIPRLVLDILTGSGGTGFLLSIGAALPIAFFALVPKAFLLFRSPFFIAVLFFVCRYQPSVWHLKHDRVVPPLRFRRASSRRRARRSTRSMSCL